MKSFDTRVYSISDFLEWKRSNTLDLSPDFQRRGVWTRVAKSFLIDTILRGMPMPKLLIMQSLQPALDLAANDEEKDEKRRNVRTVVDGQQRLRTMFEFIAGDFTVLKAHNDTYGKLKFKDLPPAKQTEILKYEVGVDVLFDVEYPDLLDIFARINTYSVVLNDQEKLNAKYLGVFKTYAYELGRDYVKYFMGAGIVTKKQVSRMQEAQLSSDLLIVLCDGIQTVKNMERYYRKYESAEEVPQELADAKGNFHKVMSFIGSIYPPEDLGNSNWSRPHLFYSLFCAVAHSLFGLHVVSDKERKTLATSRPALGSNNIARWRGALDEVSAQFDIYTKPNAEQVPQPYAKFIDFSRRRTTDTEARVQRALFILDQLN